MTPSTTPPNLLLITAGLLLVVLLALSGWQPYDRATWLMEVAPVMIALPILVATRQRFPLTSLLYACIFIHALILMLGGAYTYARVPLGFQLQDLLHLGRNPYDKIGHFAQGFVQALVARELFVRLRVVNGRRWLAEREDSPWYPGCLRLFRQPTRGDWATPIQRVAQALAAWGDGRAPALNPICTTPPQ